MKYLDLPVLRDDDKYLMIIEQEWEAIYEDTARLYSRKADSSHDRMRILEDVVRFRATPGYYRRKTLGNLRPISRPDPHAARTPVPGQLPYRAGPATGRHKILR